MKRKHAVVTIMGHVDHGKTTLIDYLRKSDIAAKEDGGITQRIGAFSINTFGERLTFIDTPGHEAFTNMRKRGASVTDLVVLVVSATEGVKKQTLEVLDLIKQMGVKFIVAISKIDLPEANIDEVEAQLQKAGLKIGTEQDQIPCIHISAKTGANVDMLCELIIEQTKNTTANFNGLAHASVLQALQTKQGLNSMTVIVEKGVLKSNALLVLGKESFKAKTMLNDKGQVVLQANPGDAVQIVGIPFVPAPGDVVFEVENDKMAKFILQKQMEKSYENNRKTNKDTQEMGSAKISFVKDRAGRKEKRAFCRGIREVWMNKFADEEQKILAKIEELRKKEGNPIIDEAILQLQIELEKHKKYVFEYLKNTGDSPDTLNFIMKFGERGMEETILMQLQKLKPSIEAETKVKLNLIKTDVGDVTVGDIEEARNCNAKIFTFGSGVSVDAKNSLQGLEPPKTHKLIHSLLKDLKDVSFAKKLNTVKGVERAKCDIAEVYTIKQKKKEVLVPGIKVTSGKITKKCKAYVFKNGLPASEALDISFIKSFKKDMLELKKGEEGTIGFAQQGITFQKGDQLAFF